MPKNRLNYFCRSIAILRYPVFSKQNENLRPLNKTSNMFEKTCQPISEKGQRQLEQVLETH